jgi:iron complex transport system ATP-binding protein
MSDGNKTVLSCKNLIVGYKGAAIIDNINLSFKAGEFVALLGPNGAGKTTLLRTLSRHLAPISGEISLQGMPLASLSQVELARVMAVVLTDKISPPLFSGFDFAALGRFPHTGFLGRLNEHDREVVSNALLAVHAYDLKDRDFASLSDGERQKILIARALAQEPEILLLDEPTAHLDLKHRMEVMAILRDLCRSENITVIASLHDVDIAARVSDRVALIKDGSIIAYGYPEETLTDKSVASLYDFDSACFSHHLGSIELRRNGAGKRLGKVFVIGGMGMGASLYRLLAKRGYEFVTGVIYENDLDFFVANSLGATCISQLPAGFISAEAVRRAVSALEGCEMVIDAGTPVDGPYCGNLRLIERAEELGRPVFRLCLREEGRKTDNNNGQFSFCAVNELLDVMEEIKK